ncbi:MAG: diacylglycerol kinase [Pseudomonadota bacterium]
MNQKPTPKTGLARIWAAFFYSLDGLRSGIGESAFRQELVIIVPAAIVLAFLPMLLIWKMILIFAMALVLIVELLNTGIESVVDIAAPEYHELAKRAKDCGSAAVLISITLAIGLWGVALFTMSW